MKRDSFGIIFSSLNDNTLSRLTEGRTVSAIPFACRYRLIDFSLSSMVNSRISNINVVANYNYRSLLSHIGSGKDFDLARRNSGIKLITPYGSSYTSGKNMFKTRLEALCSMRKYLKEYTEEYAVLFDSDVIINLNISSILDELEEKGADILFVTKRTDNNFSSKRERMFFKTEGDVISGIKLLDRYDKDYEHLALGIIVMRSDLLRSIVDEAVSEDKSSLTRYFIKNFMKNKYVFSEYKGYCRRVGSFDDYYKASMELVRLNDARSSLFGNELSPIYTRVNSSPPTRYLEGSRVVGSLVADGCVIEGEVIGSVLSRGVVVEKGAVVRNSVLFRGTRVSKGATVSNIVTDKFVTVSEGVHLSGSDGLPFYVGKGKRV